MRITDDITTVREVPTAIALGFFDGVHKGHQSVICTMMNEAIAEKLRPMVFTFEPNGEKPHSKNNIYLLQSEEQKYSIMESLGVEEVVNPLFTAFKQLTPQQFVKDLLSHTLHAKVLICGENYHFGKMAAGDTELLEQLAGELGIRVVTVPPVLKNDAWISSTRIRNAIAQGEMEEAEEMLGTSYTLEGAVEHGNKIGRTIAFPTINIPLTIGHSVPKYGVYLSKVVINNQSFWGITNVGIKPTVGVYEPASETFIFDFTEDLYGEHVLVELKSFIRPEQVFMDVTKLSKQIESDVAKALELVATMEQVEVTQ